jgi:hypothetical protein
MLLQVQALQVILERLAIRAILDPMLKLQATLELALLVTQVLV